MEHDRICRVRLVAGTIANLDEGSDDPTWVSFASVEPYASLLRAGHDDLAAAALTLSFAIEPVTAT